MAKIYGHEVTPTKVNLHAACFCEFRQELDTEAVAALSLLCPS